MGPRPSSQLNRVNQIVSRCAVLSNGDLTIRNLKQHRSPNFDETCSPTHSHAYNAHTRTEFKRTSRRDESSAAIDRKSAAEAFSQNASNASNATPSQQTRHETNDGVTWKDAQSSILQQQGVHEELNCLYTNNKDASLRDKRTNCLYTNNSPKSNCLYTNNSESYCLYTNNSNSYCLYTNNYDA